MRALTIGLIGGFIIAVALVFGGVTGGLWSFVLTITAAFLGASTLGAMAALLLVGTGRPPRRRTITHDRGESGSSGRCGVCHRAMHQLGAIWICRRCDMATNHR